MTDDDFRAAALTLLTEIRDTLAELVALSRERPVTAAPAITGANPFNFMDVIAKAAEDARARLGRVPAGTDTWATTEWSGDIEPPDDDDGKAWLVTAGTRWRWLSNIQSVDGPYCANRHRLKYQDSAQGSPKSIRDEQRLGPIGWPICPSCNTTYAVPGAITVKAMRAAVERAFRERLGLGA